MYTRLHGRMSFKAFIRGRSISSAEILASVLRENVNQTFLSDFVPNCSRGEKSNLDLSVQKLPFCQGQLDSLSLSFLGKMKSKLLILLP